MFGQALFVCIGILHWHNVAAVTAPKIKLNDGKEMPSLGLGTALGNNSQSGIQPGEEEVENAVVWALDAGYRHLTNTALVYGTEPQIGRALERKFKAGLKREEVFLTTKLWNEFHARDAVIPALRRSLHNLGVDRVDLYLIHWPLGQFANQSYDYTDYLETWRGMIEAKQLGLVTSIGVSNFNASQIDRIIASGLETPAVLQVELNLNLQQPALLSYCKQHNIAVMGYTPFGSLFYNRAKTGAPLPRVDSPALVSAANTHGKTVPQLVLRYLLCVDLHSLYGEGKHKPACLRTTISEDVCHPPTRTWPAWWIMAYISLLVREGPESQLWERIVGCLCYLKFNTFVEFEFNCKFCLRYSPVTRSGIS